MVVFFGVCMSQLKMAGRGMTSHTHVSSTEANDYLTNMNYSENFDGETSNHELQHVEK